MGKSNSEVAVGVSQSVTGDIATISKFNDGAYCCYCPYILHIARYSGFLWVVPMNTGVFLRGLNYTEKAELTKCLWYLKRKLGVTMHFSEKIKL